RAPTSTNTAVPSASIRCHRPEIERATGPWGARLPEAASGEATTTARTGWTRQPFLSGRQRCTRPPLPVSPDVKRVSAGDEGIVSQVVRFLTKLRSMDRNDLLRIVGWALLALAAVFFVKNGAEKLIGTDQAVRMLSPSDIRIGCGSRSAWPRSSPECACSFPVSPPARPSPWAA